MDKALLDGMQITRFLAAFFGQELGWTFNSERTGKVTPEEFFGPEGFLPVFVHIAKKMATRYGAGQLDIQLIDEPSALLGKEARVEAAHSRHSTVLMLLIEAVEYLCGEATPGKVVDPSALYDYLVAHPQDRDPEYDPSCVIEKD